MQCLVCKGSGVVNRWVDGAKLGVSTEEEVECPRCRGTGQVVEEPPYDHDTEWKRFGERVVYILYTNWRGETAWRRVVPWRWVFKATEKHPEPQWIMDAHDTDKKADRSFAMKDVHKWQTSKPDTSLQYKPVGAMGILGAELTTLVIAVFADPKLRDQVLALLNHGVLTTKDVDTDPQPTVSGQGLASIPAVIKRREAP